MRLDKHHMDALVLLAAEGACLRREYVVSGFPYRLGAVASCVGIRRDAISGGLRLSG